MKPHCALKVAKHMFKNKGYYHQNANDLFGLNCFSCGICHSCTRLHHFSYSKINTIVYQIDKYSMVQIWSLKFIKSILDITYVGFDKNPSDYLHILLCSFLRISNGAELLFSSLQITFGYFKQIRSSDLPQYQ